MNWEQAKTKVHDASGIKQPERWTWKEYNGVLYPDKLIPNIELKKVKTFTGHEGGGLNAEVWVDGVKTCYVIDDASGSIFYDFTVFNKPKFAELEAYVDSLPEYPLETEGKPYLKDGEIQMMKPSMEHVIDEAFEKYEMAKSFKRLEKRFATQLVWGPKEFKGDFTYVKFPKPLAEYPTEFLQKAVNNRAATLEPDERFYNTNFEALKIVV